MTPRPGNSFFAARTASCAIPFGFQDSRAASVFFSLGVTGNRAMAGTLRRTNVSHSRKVSSMDNRSIPGMEATRWRSPRPSTTNIGYIKESTLKWVSRIKRRENSSRRMRGMRVFGNELALVPVISTVTPNSSFSSANSAFLTQVPAPGRRRHRRNAVLLRGTDLEPGTDLTMKDQVGGNPKRARFQALCQSLRPDLLRFAFWLSRDRALAEDVVQETMLRAWKAQDSLLDEAAAKPWLLTIIRREYARTFERKRFVTVDVDELVAREEPMLAAAEEQNLAELRAALFKLPDEYREPLVLQVLMGFSTAEIASELGLSGAAVLTRLFRGPKQLRALCGEDTSLDPES